MKSIYSIFLAILSFFGAQSSNAETQTGSFFDLTTKTIDGTELPLSKYKGKVLLIVNTASRCGFTPQFEGLEALYTKYKEKGFEILGFPSNDFASQDPGSDAEIKEFCKLHYGVTFPMFTKNSVTGANIQPVYKFLTQETDSEFRGSVGWNFVKFLVNREGKVVGRYSSMTSPENAGLNRKIEELLQN